MSKAKEAGTSVMWDREITMIFYDLCVREVEVGNKPIIFFSKEGWRNILVKFKEMTGRAYYRMKMKNKCDQLKKDWKLWKELKRGSTGMGWDPIKQTIEAPEEWWAEKLQVHKKKFKFVRIDPVMEEKLYGMFTGVVATGTHAFTPNDIGFGSSAQEMDTVQIGDSSDRPNHVHTDVQSTSVPKHPRVEKKNKGVAFIKGTIDALVETCKARSSLHRRTAQLMSVFRYSIHILMLRQTMITTFNTRKCYEIQPSDNFL
uniref:Myb/SANT-like domain-containing protein n=1 Tax=Phalaenopsis equestris TaxID=78828 RepID=A0A3R5WSW3_PHAEQ|nr:hypothetical protein [Phalaenopsis equestris]